jgi:tRNA A37 threonylcarbamoyladenosine modification protein TsaB
MIRGDDNGMWLFLDTSQRGMARVGLLPATGPIHLQSVSGRAGGLVPVLASRIHAHFFKRLQGICVVSGPGSFSAIRSGVLVANLMARLLRLPLYGIPVLSGQDLEALRERLVHGSLRATSYVAPLYDTEPNITIPGTSAKLS